MGLIVRSLHVNHFRNYDEYTLALDQELTVIVGPNAIGKTNLLEAIQLLTEADSFRKPNWGDLVKQGSDASLLQLKAEGEGRILEVSLGVSAGGRRTYKVNDKHRKALSQVAGILPCVLFTPDDLRMVKDSAEKRRSSLDSLGVQLSPSYAQLKAEYDRVIRQRNTLLREDSSAEELEPWTNQLITLGGSLVTHRVRLFARLASAMAVAYSRLTSGGDMRARYVPSWERDSVEGDAPAEEMMRRHLEVRRDAEKARKSTISGPHRDEIVFEVEGREARAFASQGQQRTVALAWKLAEVSVVKEIAAQSPILLLDDVMSELDGERRHALAGFVGSVAQTVITTTNLNYFEESILERAKVVALS